MMQIEFTHMQKHGEYDVEILGLCEAWSFERITNSALNVTELKQWGVVGAKHIDFDSCENLSGKIPEPNKYSFEKVESFRVLFYKCTNLKTQIPENLFKYATNVVTMRNAFNMAGITGKIPKDLLKNCTKLENIGFMFSSASDLEGPIPEELFANCENITYARGVFGYLMIEEIPEKLFYYNVNLEDLGGAFSHCIQIKEIPENLLETCYNITSVTEMFYGCTILEIVPEKLFINNTEITDFRKVFADCTSLNNIQLKLTAQNANTYGAFTNVPGNIKILVPNGSKTKSDLEYRYGTSTNITIEGYDI